MVEVNLDADEGIILEEEVVTRIKSSGKEQELEGMMLTNKNLIFFWKEKENGLFSKAVPKNERIPLSEIKIINGVAQASQVKSNDYDYCLQITYMTCREQYAFEEDYKKLSAKWAVAIAQALNAEPTPTEAEEIKSSVINGFSSFASGLGALAGGLGQSVSNAAKQAADSVKEQNVRAKEAKEKVESMFSNGNVNQHNQQIQQPEVQAPEKSIFCHECGAKLPLGTKFCPECGTKLAETQLTPPPIPNAESKISNNSIERRQEFAGTVLKCPNCGEPITQTTAICPQCGMKITGQAAVTSVTAFSNQLMAIEATRKNGLGAMFGLGVDPADQQKLSLIKSFPIPNTIDDIFEFMTLAIANIDVSLSKNTLNNKYQSSMKSGETSLTIPRTISNAWVAKMQQAYQKAENAFPNDPVFKNIQQMYFDKMKELKIKL